MSSSWTSFCVFEGNVLFECSLVPICCCLWHGRLITTEITKLKLLICSWDRVVLCSPCWPPAVQAGLECIAGFLLLSKCLADRPGPVCLTLIWSFKEKLLIPELKNYRFNVSMLEICFQFLFSCALERGGPRLDNGDSNDVISKELNIQHANTHKMTDKKSWNF